MAETKIEVAITAEEVLNLKRACTTIKDAYKKHSAKVILEDEAGVYPIVYADVMGLKKDTKSSLSTLNAYDKSSLDKIVRPEEINNEDNIFFNGSINEDNYEISRDTYDKSSKDTKKILQALKHGEIRNSTQDYGGSYKNTNNIDFEKADRYQEKIRTNIEVEQINSFQGNVAENVIDGVAGLFTSTGAIEDEAKGNLQKSFDNFKDEESNTVGKFRNIIRRECIPCLDRLDNLGELEISVELLSPIQEMINRYKKLIDDLKDLLTNTDIDNDICSLLNFLEFHCVPDLYSIVALLMALMRKWSAALPNLDSIFLQFIGAFFQPILGGVSELLDRFIQLIMAPVDCVLSSLDVQLAKLDVKDALNKERIREYSELRNRESFYYKKLTDLKDRKAYLENLISNGRSENSSPPVTIGGTPRSSNADDNDVERYFSVSGYSLFPKKSIKEELVSINREIEEINNKDLVGVQKEIEENRSSRNNESVWNDIVSGVGGARESLRDFRGSLSTSLVELRGQILNGRKMINDTLKLHLEELERMVLGRAATSGEILNGAKEVQKLARLISIVRTLIELGKYGKLCNNNNNDPNQALGSFLSANSAQGRPSYNIYKGTGEDGEVLLIANSDSQLEVTDKENILSGDSNSTGKTVYDNLDEIMKLNANGIAQDIGDVSTKDIKAFSKDLNVETKVTIMKFDLCNNSNFSTKPDVESIKNWAINAGLNK